MSAALQLVKPDPDLLFMEWREEVARVVHSCGLAHQLVHIEEGEWRRSFDAGAEAFDAVMEQADRLV